MSQWSWSLPEHEVVADHLFFLWTSILVGDVPLLISVGAPRKSLGYIIDMEKQNGSLQSYRKRPRPIARNMGRTLDDGSEPARVTNLKPLLTSKVWERGTYRKSQHLRRHDCLTMFHQLHTWAITSKIVSIHHQIMHSVSGSPVGGLEQDMFFACSPVETKATCIFRSWLLAVAAECQIARCAVSE